MNHTKNKFVFLFPFSAVSEEKYGIGYLRNRGFDVVVLDVSALLRNRAFRLYGNLLQNGCSKVDKVASFVEFEDLISQVSDHSIFIDYLVGLSYLTLENERIFRILKKYNATYYVISGGALPPGIIGDHRRGRWMLLQSRIRKLMNPRKVLDLVCRETIQFVRNYSRLYPLPHKIFSGRSEILERYVQRHGRLRDRIVPIHSLDYDAYLRFVKENGPVDMTEGSYALFLDEAAADHPDFEVLKMKGLDKHQYFEAMRDFFDRVERETGLKVIIAAHPFSSYGTKNKTFGDREIITGRTIALVARARFVIMHSTTAINFAVLFGKPILFVKTDDMIEKGRSQMIDSMANALGVRAVNVSRKEEPCLERMATAGECYESYLYKYIKSKGVQDKTVWEIVADEARNERVERLHA